MGLKVRLNEFFLTVNPAVCCSAPDAAEIEFVAAASEPVFIAEEPSIEFFFNPGVFSVSAYESLF